MFKLKNTENEKQFGEVVERFPLSNDPKKNPILYHYCNLNTFLSLIQNKCFWLSDINSMNDYSEMHWAYDRFIEAANHEYEAVGRDFLDHLDRYVSSAQTRLLPLVCCFSTDGDVLSQWRAYADDGKGVAIGFDASLIDELSTRTAEVIYDNHEQTDHFRTLIRAMNDVYLELPEDERDDFLAYSGTHAGIDLCCFKNPAFSEEREVRIIRSIVVRDENGGVSFQDVGGGASDEASSEALSIEFRERDGGLIAYLKLPFSGLGSGFIKEVVLGPKTRNNGVEVLAALEAAGFNTTSVRTSSATYR